MKYFLDICVFLLFIFLCFMQVEGYAQQTERVRPLPLNPLLSGGFGELRATHFHTGVDFKTGGKEGIPVVCVADGVVARVSVSPAGYGLALYVEHGDGTTTVYGHLQRYNKKITAVVRDIQYRNECFAIDEDVKGNRLFFRQGDTLAFSGNSGSSGGPHLHFEIRNTKTEKVINPLHHYKIKDKVPPKIRATYLYRISGQGEVERFREIIPRDLKNGIYDCGKSVVSSGKIGIGVWIEDLMNDSWSKLGVYRLEVFSNGEKIMNMQVDTLSFDLVGFIHEIKDYELYNRKRATVYKCFGNYHSQYIGVDIREDGCVHVGQDSSIVLKVVASDINGNRTILNMTLVGGVAASGTTNSEELLFYDRPYVLSLGDFKVEIDSNSLLCTVKGGAHMETAMLYGQQREMFCVTDKEEPLLKKAKISFVENLDSRTLICAVNPAGRVSALKTGRDSSGIFTRVGVLGKYTVLTDSVPPVVNYTGISQGNRLCFKIKDDLSGIGSFRGEVNHKWTLFEYDAKTGLLTCAVDEPAFVRGKVNFIRLEVKDGVGNQRITEIKY